MNPIMQKLTWTKQLNLPLYIHCYELLKEPLFMNYLTRRFFLKRTRGMSTRKASPSVESKSIIVSLYAWLLSVLMIHEINPVASIKKIRPWPS
jgi:hypothetical protein